MKKQFTILVCLLSLTIFAQDKRLAKIDSLLNYLSENDKFMGSLCIRQGDEIVFSEAYGYLEATKGISANRGTKYKIGSITKTFTATMIMQLVEENKLTLATKLSKFYPKIDNANAITIAHLLYQRTGIKDYLNADSTVVSKVYVENKPEDIIATIANYKSLFEPDSKHEYSNSNYFILGCILEKITKKSYAENLKIRITDKLNLKNTYYPTGKIDVKNRESYSYMFNGNTWEPIPEFNSSILFSTGAIMSTPEDLTKFNRELFKGTLVTPASLEVMKTLKDTYGMALIRFPFGERKFFGHNGKIEGFEATMGYYEKDDVAISLLINGENYLQNDIMIGILSCYYKLPFPFPVFTKLDPSLLSKYVGDYTSKDIPLEIKVFENNGNLLAQATGQPSFSLTYSSDTVFVFAQAGIEIEFTTNGFVLKQGGAKFNYTKK